MSNEIGRISDAVVSEQYEARRRQPHKGRHIAACYCYLPLPLERKRGEDLSTEEEALEWDSEDRRLNPMRT